MGARHRAQADRIHILKVQPIKTSDAKRPHIKAFHDSKIKFPFPIVFRSVGTSISSPLASPTRTLSKGLTRGIVYAIALLFSVEHYVHKVILKRKF